MVTICPVLAGSIRNRPATTVPGLKALEPVEIEALGAATLIEPLQLVAQRDHLLVIDLPGEELPVLQALWKRSSYTSSVR